MRPGRFEFILALFLIWALAVIIGAAPRRRNNRRRISELRTDSTTMTPTTTPMPQTTISIPPTCDRSCCADLGFVENRCGEKDFFDNETLALRTTLETPGNVTVMPKVSKLRSVENNLDSVRNTTNSTQPEAEVGNADKGDQQPKDYEVPENVHYWSPETAGWVKYTMEDFLGAYCPKSRKERSVPHFEPVTCDDGVICSPRFVRRAECVAHTGANCKYPCGGPSYKDCFVVPTPPDDHGMCLEYDCANGSQSDPVSMAATGVGASLGIVLVAAMVAFLLMKKYRIAIRRSGFYRLPAFKEDDVERQESDELDRIVSNAAFVDGSLRANLADDVDRGQAGRGAAEGNAGAGGRGAGGEEAGEGNAGAGEGGGAAGGTGAGGGNATGLANLNVEVEIHAPPDVDVENDVDNKNKEEEQGNQETDGHLRYEDIMERSSLATIYEHEEETDQTNEELEWDHSYGYRLVDIDYLIDSDSDY